MLLNSTVLSETIPLCLRSLMEEDFLGLKSDKNIYAKFSLGKSLMICKKKYFSLKQINKKNKKLKVIESINLHVFEYILYPAINLSQCS